ncbi:MAG: 3-phosphoshikimate 1-carboxyvinyltransferase [Candidatus Korobacteraceae bacterium]
MSSDSSSVVIRPARNLMGALRLPGDKSISHRYAMLGGIAEGITRLENFSTGADCASTLACMAALGVLVKRESGGVVTLEGRPGSLISPLGALDCGNSGSTMRMLAGILSGQPFSCEMIGDESLSRRPMNRVITPLEQMGARIESRGGRPPLRVTGGPLRAIDYKMPIPSAQVKSAVLFAGLFAEGTTWVEESVRTRDHSEIALRAFGVQLDSQPGRVGITGGQRLRGIEATVPGDISSAAFFLCAAALFPESNLVIDDVLLNPTRAVLLDVLAAMGVQTSMVRVEERHGELVGTIRVQPPKVLRGARIAGAQAAALIDELPVLAAIAPYTSEGMEIRDARELRVKESDRIAAVAANLRAMGANVEEHDDGMHVPGGQSLKGGIVNSAGDHRIAMAFAVAALRATHETVIHGAGAASISYPEFFQALDQLLER